MEQINSSLKELNDFNLKVNSDLIRHIKASGTTNERVLLLLSHIISAHQIWNGRINGQIENIAVFGLRDFDDLSQQVVANHVATKAILESKKETDEVIYINTKGTKFSNSISQILLHVYNHHAYHRGQINQLLVQEGNAAMVADYIVYNRNEI